MITRYDKTQFHFQGKDYPRNLSGVELRKPIWSQKIPCWFCPWPQFSHCSSSNMTSDNEIKRFSFSLETLVASLPWICKMSIIWSRYLINLLLITCASPVFQHNNAWLRESQHQRSFLTVLLKDLKSLPGKMTCFQEAKKQACLGCGDDSRSKMRTVQNHEGLSSDLQNSCAVRHSGGSLYSSFVAETGADRVSGSSGHT